MFYVYILWSSKWSRYYIGQTQNIESRLLRHNEGKVKSTRGGIPWMIKHMIAVSSRTEAVTLEKRIKKRGAKRFLEDLHNG